jgi:nitrous oxidase accessory protein
VNASFPGSARLWRAGERLRRSRTFLQRLRFSQQDSSVGRSSSPQDAATSTLQACAPRIIVAALFVTTCAGATTLQQRIDTAAPNEIIHVAAGVHAGSITISKPITLVGEPGAEIRGNGSGKVITIAADDVTLRGLRITGSGLQLSDDDAAVFVIANNATIENCTIADSLHGIYLKKVSGAQILNNRIQGKTILGQASPSDDGLGSHRSEDMTAGKPSLLEIEKGVGQTAENCDTALVANRRGNGIHQWNCERNLIRGNEITDARDGIYFSFTNNSRVENNVIRHVRYGLHYMYSDANIFENNTFTENAAGAAIMFSKNMVVRGNRFISNRGYRAYGLIFQSSDNSRLEQNDISENAVGLSFNQCNQNEVIGNRVTRNYIGLRFGSNSDANRFTENIFTGNLHPIETGASDVSGSLWAVHGVGNLWDTELELDLDRDGIVDVPHRELDLFGILRRDFPAIAFLSDSPAVKLLRFANERAVIPGMSSIEDPAPLTSRFWRIRAQRAARTALVKNK